MCCLLHVTEAINFYFMYLEKKEIFVNLCKILICFLPIFFMVIIKLSVNIHV